MSFLQERKRKKHTATAVIACLLLAQACSPLTQNAKRAGGNSTENSTNSTDSTNSNKSNNSRDLSDSGDSSNSGDSDERYQSGPEESTTGNQHSSRYSHHHHRYHDRSKSKGKLPAPDHLLMVLKEVKPLKEPHKYKPEPNKDLKETDLKQLELAWSKFRERDYKEAVRIAYTLKEKFPSSARVQCLYGYVLLADNRFRDAGIAFYTACQKDPRYYESWEGLSTVYMRLRRFNDCLAALKYLTRLAPGETFAWIGLGTIYVELEQGKLAEANLKKALALEPNNFMALFTMGYDYHCQERYIEAEKFYKQALKVKPDDRSTLFYLAQTQARMGKREESANSFEKLAELDRLEMQKNPQFSKNRDLISSSNALMVEGKLDDAKKLLDEAISLDPRSPEGYLGLASLQMSQGKAKEAEVNFKKAARYSDGLLDATELVARAKLSGGDLKETINYLESALKKNPGDHKLHCLISYAYFKKHDLTKAKKHALEATRLSSRDEEGWILLSNVYSKEGNMAGSIEALKKVVLYRPDYSSAIWLILIHHLLGENRVKEAGKALEKATYIYPNDFNIYLAYGLLFRNLDEQDKAKENLRKAVALDPQNAYAWNQLAIVLENTGEAAARKRAIERARAARDQSYEIGYYDLAYDKFTGNGHSEFRRHRRHSGSRSPREAPHAFTPGESGRPSPPGTWERGRGGFGGRGGMPTPLDLQQTPDIIPD